MDTILFVSKFGVVNSEGFILLLYNANKFFKYDEVISLFLKKRVVRKYQIITILFSILLLFFSLILTNFYIITINILLSLGLIVISRYFVFNRYRLFLNLASGEFKTFEIKKEDVYDIKKYLKKVSVNLKKKPTALS